MKRSAAALAVLAFGLAGCTGGSPTEGPSPTGAPSATSAAPSGGSTAADPSPTFTEPTTTNTLPPPPPASSAAPSTAGKLSAKSLPVPEGWKTIVREGGSEEGYQGNGTWVRGRDPRYAAQDVITIGCTQVTRDDYTDPTTALEGTYVDGEDRPGIGLVFEFAEAADAKAYFDLYQQQIKACDSDDDPATVEILPSEAGLIDHRTYSGEDEWTEVGLLKERRLTLIILTDPGHKISKQRADALLKQISDL